MLTKMNHARLSGEECWFGRLNEVRVPALVIHGDADRTCPRELTGKRTSVLPARSCPS